MSLNNVRWKRFKSQIKSFNHTVVSVYIYLDSSEGQETDEQTETWAQGGRGAGKEHLSFRDTQWNHYFRFLSVQPTAQRGSHVKPKTIKTNSALKILSSIFQVCWRRFPIDTEKSTLRGLNTLPNAAKRKVQLQTDTQRHHFKHGGLTAGDLHQQPWEPELRGTYLSERPCCFAVFHRGTTSYSVWDRKRFMCCSRSIIFFSLRVSTIHLIYMIGIIDLAAAKPTGRWFMPSWSHGTDNW